MSPRAPDVVTARRRAAPSFILYGRGDSGMSGTADERVYLSSTVHATREVDWWDRIGPIIQP